MKLLPQLWGEDGEKLMDYCSICKSRNTWDCEDERETGRTKCDDFDLDFNAISDEKTKHLVQNIVLASLMLKEES